MTDDAQPVSYRGVALGVPVLSATGAQFGTLEQVLEIPSADLFDGVVVSTDQGPRFVDRDQIAEITTQYISCTIDDDAVAALPEPSGTVVFEADPRHRGSRSFGDWMRRTFGRNRSDH